MNRKKKKIRRSPEGLYPVKTKLRARGLFDNMLKKAKDDASKP